MYKKLEGALSTAASFLPVPEHYLELLESFQKRKLSVSANDALIKILHKLSLELDIHLMSELPKNPAPYKNSYIYIKTKDTQELYYVKLDGEYEKAKINDFKEFNEQIDKIKKKDETTLHLSKEQINTIVTSNGGHAPANSSPFCDSMRTYFKTVNRDGLPFTNFDSEPDNITQIKKIVNALHYAHLGFSEVEKIDLRKSENNLENLKLIYQSTTYKIYQACYLLTHLDIDIHGLFHDELSIVLPMLQKVIALGQEYSKLDMDKAKGMATTVFNYPISHTAGYIAGVAVDQMQPNSGDTDYGFLTQFSAVLPSYLEKFSDIVRQYSSIVIEKEPTLGKEKLQELQKAALDLLNDLETLKTSSFIAPLKYIRYIHVIQNIITLSMSSLDQMGSLSGSTQDAIRAHLAKIKYELIPTLFGLVDKLENNAMVIPGTWSNPLMEQIKPIYDFLIHYAKKPVDFTAKGEELLLIEDSRFVDKRLELTYKRINAAKKELVKIGKVEHAFTEFYKILERPEYANYAIYQLPADIKAQLKTHYKILRPYMTDIDVDFNNLIIDSFNAAYSYVGQAWHWIKKDLPKDHISSVIQKKSALHTRVNKKRNTAEFHIRLNNELMNNVKESSAIVLFPYPAETNVYQIDEGQALMDTTVPNKKIKYNQIPAGSNLITNIEVLTANEALDEFQWYDSKLERLDTAEKAYDKLMLVLEKHKNFSEITETDRAECLNAYYILQPYFVSGLSRMPNLSEEEKKTAVNLDKNMSHFLSKKLIDIDSLQSSLILFTKLKNDFKDFFANTKHHWAGRRGLFLNQFNLQYTHENNQATLAHNAETKPREHHVIPHTHFSEFFAKFRKDLYSIRGILNTSMQKEFTAQPTGLPFPELKDDHKVLHQSRQLIGFKRIFNHIYHLEGIFLELEKLENNSTQIKYVWHLYQSYAHIDEISHLSQAIMKDPHFKLIGGVILNKAQMLLSTIQEHTEAYAVDAKNYGTQDSVKYNSLWYVVNAFYVTPNHIRMLTSHNNLTSKELDSLHEKAKTSVQRIEAIIDSADSYFKLFLQAPNMYKLYRELTAKLNEFTTTTHDTVIDNLDVIKAKIIAPMLLEADLWEDKLGLKPGLFSGPLKHITDEFFQGLLEPLGLHSSTHTMLVNDLTPIKNRVERAKTKMVKTDEKLNALDKKYEHINTLYKHIQDYQKFNSGTPSSGMIIDLLEDAMKKEMLKCHYQLARQQQKVTVKPAIGTISTAVNSMLKEVLSADSPKLDDIVALVTACHNRYVGKKATYQMKLDTAKEKMAYLTQLQANQEIENIRFIEKYTETSFTKYLELLVNRHVGLQFRDTEYSEKLQAYLLTFKHQITQAAKSALDINFANKQLLVKKIRLFEKEHFAGYYQLDSVQAALAQFKVYFSKSTIAIREKSTIFESESTLAKKTALINQLDNIAKDTQLSVAARIEEIKKQVQDSNFERFILAHKKADYFSFTFLLQCIVSLLQALHIYTPEKDKLFRNLRQTIDKEPKIHDLTKRFGLFSEPEKEYQAPTLPESTAVPASVAS